MGQVKALGCPLLKAHPVCHNQINGPRLAPLTTQTMNFWTPARCKTISTMQLMENSLEISAQAVITKNPETAKAKMAIVEMIQAELRERLA